jgi:hypothetical protein
LGDTCVNGIFCILGCLVVGETKASTVDANEKRTIMIRVHEEVVLLDEDDFLLTAVALTLGKFIIIVLDSIILILQGN